MNGLAKSVNAAIANILITSGADNDSIQNNGANVTISGGKGFDSIRNEGSNVLVQYNFTLQQRAGRI